MRFSKNTTSLDIKYLFVLYECKETKFRDIDRSIYITAVSVR